MHAIEGFDGFGFALNPRNKPKFSIYSVEPDSPAYSANLRANDVIVQINKQNIRRLKFDKVRQIIKEASEKGQIEILAIDQDGYNYNKQRKRRFSSKRLVTPENTDYFSTNYGLAATSLPGNSYIVDFYITSLLN